MYNKQLQVNSFEYYVHRQQMEMKKQFTLFKTLKMLGDKLSTNKGQAFNKIKEQGIMLGAMGGTIGSRNDESLMSEDSMSII